MGSVRVAVIGVGNCAAALVQGVEYYRQAPDDGFVPGLMRPRIGQYHVGDIEFSAAFDIDARKVGLDLSEAITAAPNNTVQFASVPSLGVAVQRGMTHDGLGHYLSQVISKASGATADIANILRETRTDIVVNFLPVGSEMATKWYVEQVLEAGCGFVNCIPVFIAREAYWRHRFEERGLPVVGVTLEMSGPEEHDCQFVAEAIFLASPILRASGKRVALAGPTGRETLVGLRLWLEQKGAPPRLA